MSRIGRMPIAVPAGVTVDIAENNKVTVKGPKGELTRVLPEAMDIKKDGEEIVVTRPNDLKKNKALHGLTRTLIYNMVIGVTEGYEKVLEVNGVGYRAQKQGKKLVLSLGYSHPVEWKIQKESKQYLMVRIRLLLRELIKKKLASTLQKSEVRELLNLIRVRVSNTILKLSDVKLVRLVRNN